MSNQELMDTVAAHNKTAQDHINFRESGKGDEKIEKILSYGCLKKVTAIAWVCRPIPGYNKTTYTLMKNLMSGNWSCNCQGYKQRKTCAHQRALLRLLGEANAQQMTFIS